MPVVNLQNYRMESVEEILDELAGLIYRNRKWIFRENTIYFALELLNPS